MEFGFNLLHGTISIVYLMLSLYASMECYAAAQGIWNMLAIISNAV